MNPKTKRNKEIAKLRRIGRSCVEISKWYGITKERVSQICNALNFETVKIPEMSGYRQIKWNGQLKWIGAKR